LHFTSTNIIIYLHFARTKFVFLHSMESKEIKQRSNCPISYCLDFVGDRWTLLIIRDLMFEDKHTFGDFASSKEGIATNILTDRLKMLETEGYLFKFPVQGKARTGYCLTEKGIALIPIVIEMLLFGVAQGFGNRPGLEKQLKKDKAGVIKKLAADLRKKYNTAKKEAAS